MTPWASGPIGLVSGFRRRRCKPRKNRVRWTHLIEVIGFFLELFRLGGGDDTILLRDETIIRFDAELRKPRMVINVPTKRRATPTGKPETVTCRASALSSPSPSSWSCPRWLV